MSECGKCIILVENDMPIGNFHDFLLSIKGHMVDKMVSAQKQEEEISKKMQQDELQEGSE